MLRIGQGYDVHATDINRALFLGGVKIESSFGLIGHSDADVLLHAISDAVLGALGWGDIGKWYPDTDAKWKDADSFILLNNIWKEAAAKGWELVNIDSVIIAEAPKIAPYISQMQTRISSAFNASSKQVSVKATTNEKLGFVGRGEGIAATAIVLLSKPS
jgi:2-C-methyl-D-erythritol 2,4-cyclodiphosphate synthase